MNTIGFLLALVFFGLVALRIALELKKPSIKGMASGATTEVGQYRARDSVFTRSEAAFFGELIRQLPDGYHVFPKMRVADVLETTARGRDYYRQRNKILPKHIDFMVCNQYFKPVVAIEVNGSSHRRARVQESDDLKKEIFEMVGIPLKTVPVGSSFASAVQEVVKYV